MKRKTTIAYAMTLVIAGLLITTAVGLPTMNEKPSAETKNNNNVDSNSIAALIEEYNIDLDLTTKKIVKAEKQMSTEKTKVEAEATLVELSEEKQTVESYQQPTGSRAVLVDNAWRPGIGDKHDGNVFLGFEYHYTNDSEVPSAENPFNGVLWQGSDNYGWNNWTTPWYLNRSGTPEEYPITYPSIDYMDYNDSEGGNVFYATFNELTETFQDPSDGRWYNGTNVTFMKVAYGDIDNPEVWVRTWTAFGRTTRPPSGFFKYWHDMAMSDIAAADDFYFQINRTWQPFGLMSLVVDIYSEDPGDPSTDNGCNWFYPIEYQPQMGGPWINRYGLMWHYIDIDGAQATSTDIDKTPNAITGNPEDKKAYAVWDPLDDVNPLQHILLITALNMSNVDGMNSNFHYTGYGDPWDGVGWSMVSADLSLEYPEIAAGNDGEIVIAMEMVNLTDSDQYLSLWYCNSSNGDPMNLSISGTWDFDQGPASYPEVSWICDNTYILHWIMDDKLYAAFSYDGGYSWAENQSAGWIEYYQWSGSETVRTDYRAVELSDEASMSMWEYIVANDPAPPPIEIITRLFYSYNTVEISGDVYDEFGDPANNVEYVKMINFNTSNIKTAILDGNHYTFCAILGIEIWTDAHILLQAREGTSIGDEYVIFGTFNGTGGDRGFSEKKILFVNTFDLQYGNYICKADFDIDGDVDLSDYAKFSQCFGGAGNPYSCTPVASPIMYWPSNAGKNRADFDKDDDVDLSDYAKFSQCFGGAGNPYSCTPVGSPIMFYDLS